MKKILLPAIIFLLLTACGSPSPEPSDVPGSNVPTETAPAGPTQAEGYAFTVRGVTVSMGQPAGPYIESLGEPQNLFEAPSCAFEGIDRIYTYPGFQLYTFPKDGADYVLSVILTDDSLATDKGIYLGRTLADVTAAYGGGYAQNQGEYTYTLGSSSLSFLIEDGEVAAIAWRYLAG